MFGSATCLPGYWPCSVCARLTHTSPFSYPTKSFSTIPRITLTPSIWRTCYISVKILCWRSFSLSPLRTYDISFVREFDYLTRLQIVYLIVSVTYEHKTVLLISLIMIGAVYGLQALVFVLRHKWDVVGWMVFEILAIPIFLFVLPIYSFWHMDDFSCGTMRIVLGESGKKFIILVSAFICKVFHDWFVQFRMRACLIPDPSLSRPGMTTCVCIFDLVYLADLYARKMSSGTENRSIVLARGCLLPSSSMMVTPNPASHHCMTTKHITSPAASHLSCRSLVFFFLDTNPVAIRPCQLAICDPWMTLAYFPN